MTKTEIETIFEDLKQATLDYYEISAEEDTIKLEKTAKYKELKLAREEASSIRF